MDAIRILTDDHRKVKALFTEYEEAGERAHKKRQGIVEQVFHELQIHTQIEEEVFYPAIEAEAAAEGQDLVAESLQEHHVVDVLMSEMQALAPDDSEYAAKFQVLMENVEHHADEEEHEMFPLAKKKLDEQLQQLGDQLEQRKAELLADTR
jgi:hemerythrin superfamily protein